VLDLEVLSPAVQVIPLKLTSKHEPKASATARVPSKLHF